MQGQYLCHAVVAAEHDGRLAAVSGEAVIRGAVDDHRLGDGRQRRAQGDGVDARAGDVELDGDRLGAGSGVVDGGNGLAQRDLAVGPLADSQGGDAGGGAIDIVRNGVHHQFGGVDVDGQGTGGGVYVRAAAAGAAIVLNLELEAGVASANSVRCWRE